KTVDAFHQRSPLLEYTQESGKWCSGSAGCCWIFQHLLRSLQIAFQFLPQLRRVTRIPRLDVTHPPVTAAFAKEGHRAFAARGIGPPRHAVIPGAQRQRRRSANVGYCPASRWFVQEAEAAHASWEPHADQVGQRWSKVFQTHH